MVSAVRLPSREEVEFERDGPGRALVRIIRQALTDGSTYFAPASATVGRVERRQALVEQPLRRRCEQHAAL
ncbi:hypothetical protein D6T63_14805 [Arthrobacter cheniae]|uniref:Uncharacterized protein n=1 Tax=Arthrobacter cheniae TaxID=1258888 RepID=A0A3A5LYX7_9MICC|nr:hypothetical protein [Arthrobacter cheniae]RJT77813.1 hypothetical protein D6T63_14805 [Arthrobacter cheniae]